MQLIRSYWWLGLTMLGLVIVAIVFIPGDFRQLRSPKKEIGFEWTVPDINRVAATPGGDLIRYGRELVAHTSVYLGPKGSVKPMSNGMNCQNCHLQAGTKLWGNNYSAVFSTYPKFRARSGSIETIYKRINDCFERSLNGESLDSNSREMQAIYSYICWLGKNVPKNIKPEGVGIADIPFLNRPADPSRGQVIYMQHCKRCHASDGKGALNADSTAYQYPPLWGKNSYNTGAGLYRIGRLAGYIKYNMPNDFAERNDVAQLTNEEAWDVAGFILSQPRPEKKFVQDWPDISKKPIDHPFGPYKDSFTELQHKYGPFTGMLKPKTRF